ncbi:hypothetical protein NUW58_g2603 [Xylaria curta]|uniref:Uncharacterized protein n=2 Tax=Xylaria curta TaxID=42375 RepID=A0ACC1PG73_9PEZI|nr:hypothetical protein NUW58_g2972 [Xylaria curta]KAJ2991198.1 hypothetical protein NUW58_g2603 [Xylaria curta]
MKPPLLKFLVGIPPNCEENATKSSVETGKHFASRAPILKALFKGAVKPPLLGPRSSSGRSSETHAQTTAPDLHLLRRLEAACLDREAALQTQSLSQFSLLTGPVLTIVIAQRGKFYSQAKLRDGRGADVVVLEEVAVQPWMLDVDDRDREGFIDPAGGHLALGLLAWRGYAGTNLYSRPPAANGNVNRDWKVGCLLGGAVRLCSDAKEKLGPKVGVRSLLRARRKRIRFMRMRHTTLHGLITHKHILI